MAFSMKHALTWSHSLKKDKIKKKIANLSNEWEQLTQYLMLLEDTIFNEGQTYNKMYNELQAKHVQLMQYQQNCTDIKNILTDMISMDEVNPKEFQHVTSEMFELLCDVNRIQAERQKLQQVFNETYHDREEKKTKLSSKVDATKARISHIEGELSKLKLFS
jgi:chromosome segregation ATPase